MGAQSANNTRLTSNIQQTQVVFFAVFQFEKLLGWSVGMLRTANELSEARQHIGWQRRANVLAGDGLSCFLKKGFV